MPTDIESWVGFVAFIIVSIVGVLVTIGLIWVVFWEWVDDRRKKANRLCVSQELTEKSTPSPEAKKRQEELEASMVVYIVNQKVEFIENFRLECQEKYWAYPVITERPICPKCLHDVFTYFRTSTCTTSAPWDKLCYPGTTYAYLRKEEVRVTAPERLVLECKRCGAQTCYKTADAEEGA